jgi:peptidoglycan/xylan/chitin deacetylase (PgdA/CDA1 family)
MSRKRSVGKSVLRTGTSVVVFLIFGSCSSSPIEKKNSAADRAPASVAAKFGLSCVAESPMLANFHTGRPASDFLTAELAAGFALMPVEEQQRATALALAEAFAYGQKLLGEYEALLDRGQTLDQIMQSSTVYAELQALFFIKHDLERFAEYQFADSLVNNMETEPGRGRQVGLHLVNFGTARQLAKWKAFVAERMKTAGYDTLALADTESAMNDLQLFAATCGDEGDSSFAGGGIFAQIGEFSRHVMNTARALPKNPTAYRAFQPKFARSVSVESVVKSRAKAIQADWGSSLGDRSPQSASVGKVIYPDPGKAGNIFGTSFPRGTWALTFDDGPHGGTRTTPSYTQAVLANLRAHDMKATFFVLSQQIERGDCSGIDSRIKGGRPNVVHPELALAERAQGNAVESHSYYHSDIPKDTDAEQDCEINQAIGVYANVMGRKPYFFRLPYGSGVSVPKVRKLISDAGMIHVYWSVDTLDWQDHDPDSIYRRAVKAIQNGGRGVILFHDIHPQSVIASEKVMGYLKDPANGLETVTIPQIVDRVNGTATDTHFGAH